MTDTTTFRDLAAEALEQLLAANEVTGTELQQLINRAGRTHGPHLLVTAYLSEKIHHDEIASVIGGIWAMADLPDANFCHDLWREMFDLAGFTVDGERRPRPDQPMLLFRGSVPERRNDWSWTPSIDVARNYADGHIPGRAKGRIWVCEVPPAHMLAINTERGEDEIVVDTRGLTIREASR